MDNISSVWIGLSSYISIAYSLTIEWADETKESIIEQWPTLIPLQGGQTTNKIKIKTNKRIRIAELILFGWKKGEMIDYVVILFFLFVFNVLDENQCKLQQQEFKSAECFYPWNNASSSIDQSVATYSYCSGEWKGELNKPANITKISLIYLKRHHDNIPKVSVRMKGQQQSQICTNEKGKTANSFHFDCHGNRSDTVEINVRGWLFDVKAYCEFKFFLFSFIKLIIIKISFKFLSFTFYNINISYRCYPQLLTTNSN